jgi:hypothetical protein
VSAAAPTARPDLYFLLDKEPETVAHLLLAEIGGATWRKHSGGDWWLIRPTFGGGFRDLFALWAGATRWEPTDLPRPLHDDGDAWRLTMREELAVGPRRLDDPGQGYMVLIDFHDPGVIHMDPRRAVVLAALRKHDHDARWADLIPALLSRLEEMAS